MNYEILYLSFRASEFYNIQCGAKVGIQFYSV